MAHSHAKHNGIYIKKRDLANAKSLYLIYFADGEFKTAHYSLCTAFMALSMMLPGMVAGYIQESVGYTNFFIFVMVCCLVTVLVTMAVKVPAEYGKKQ